MEGCNLLLVHTTEQPARGAAATEPAAADSSSQERYRLPPGCPYSPAAVLGHFLRFLHEHLRQQLASSFTAEAVKRAEVKYCIAIPAGLSDEAKRLVRQ